MADKMYVIFSDGSVPFSFGPYTRDAALAKLRRIRERITTMSLFIPAPTGTINELCDDRWELVTKHHKLDPRAPRRYVLCPLVPPKDL